MYYPYTIECNKVEESTILYSLRCHVYPFGFNCHPPCGRQDLRKSAKTIYGFCEYVRDSVHFVV